MDRLNRGSREILRRILTAIPYFLLLVSAFSGYFSSHKFYKHFRETYLGDLSGYSVVTGVFMLLVFFREKHDYCLHTRLSSIVLITMNVISMYYRGNNMYYNPMYDFWIGTIVVFVSIFAIYDFGSYLIKLFNKK